jgi:DNA repair protein RecN (Recombination protein N)
LLRTETHIELLDEYGRLEGLREEYKKSYSAVRAVASELDSLRAKEEQYAKMLDVYDFQLKEIDDVGPAEGEEEGLDRERKILENAERLYETTAKLHGSLYDGDQSAHDLLVAARNQIEDLAEIDPAFSPLREECNTATVIVEELTKFLQSYSSRIEFNPERLEQIRDRLGQLSLLRKKYGGSIEAVVKHREEIAREFEVATHFEDEIRSLETSLQKATEALADVGHRLSGKRFDRIQRISQGVEKTLATLGIPNGRFVVQIEPLQAKKGSLTLHHGNDQLIAGPLGLDDVEFLLSTNPGEDPKPLAKIASGGEISRVMLALKSILAKSERLPLLVFDEIDTGISGRIAQAVGKMLKSLASFHQIIAITHLPQIAGLADAHYAVEKKEAKGRTMTQLRPLQLEERVSEVAKLLSGSVVTQSSLDGARELMGLEG